MCVDYTAGLILCQRIVYIRILVYIVLMKGDVMAVADRIIELRTKLKMNRTKFTAVLGLKSRVTTYFWETGIRAPDINNAYKLLELAHTVGLEWKLEMLLPKKPRPRK